MSERDLRPEVLDYVQRVRRFVVEEILPHETRLIRHSANPNTTSPHPLMERFKVLFLPLHHIKIKVLTL